MNNKSYRARSPQAIMLAAATHPKHVEHQNEPCPPSPKSSCSTTKSDCEQIDLDEDEPNVCSREEEEEEEQDNNNSNDLDDCVEEQLIVVKNELSSSGSRSGSFVDRQQETGPRGSAGRRQSIRSSSSTDDDDDEHHQRRASAQVYEDNRSSSEEEDEQGVHRISDPEYNPEREYFSDPDYHDERPGKGRSCSSKQQTGDSSDSSCQIVSTTKSSCVDSVSVAESAQDTNQYDGDDSELGERGDTWRSNGIESSSSSGPEDEALKLTKVGSEVGLVEAGSGEEVDGAPAAGQAEQDSEQGSEQLREAACGEQATEVSSEARLATASEALVEQFSEDDLEEAATTEASSNLHENSANERTSIETIGSGNGGPANGCHSPVTDEHDSEPSKGSQDDGTTSKRDDRSLNEQQKASYQEEAHEQHASSTGQAADEFKWRKRRQLMELVNDYCDKLVELIKEEALKQLELILGARDSAAADEQRVGGSVRRLHLSNRFESDSSSCRITHETNKADDDDKQESPARPSADGGDQQQVLKTKCRRVYTSSLFYDDKRGSYPTIEVQLDRCQTIVKQLESGLERAGDRDEGGGGGGGAHESNSAGPEGDAKPAARRCLSDRASLMFRKRRERMRHYTIGSAYDLVDQRRPSSSGSGGFTDGLRRTKSSSGALAARLESFGEREQAAPPVDRSSSVDDDDNERDAWPAGGALTDTEYEAPQVAKWTKLASSDTNGSTNSGGKRIAHRPKYKPFLDSTTLKDIERLRDWCPGEQFNEHQSVSPETCHRLAADLSTASRERKAPPSRGALLFERRQLESSEWVVPDDLSRTAVVADKEQIEVGVHTAATTCAQAEARSADLAKPTCPPADGPHTMSASTETSERDALRPKAAELGGGGGGGGGSPPATDDTASQLEIRQEGQRLLRPSIAEETVLVAENACQEQLVELTPLVLSHQQARLELATVTRTPSFGTSSRRIIECDSPEDRHLCTSSSSSSVASSLEHFDGPGESDDDNGEANNRAGRAASNSLTTALYNDEPAPAEGSRLVVDQPRIQVNDRDLSAESDATRHLSSGGAQQVLEVAAAEPEEVTSPAAASEAPPDGLAFDGPDLGHRAVVRSGPLGATTARHWPADGSCSEPLRCFVERLAEGPQVQFATLQYHGASTGPQRRQEDEEEAADKTRRRVIDEKSAAGEYLLQADFRRCCCCCCCCCRSAWRQFQLPPQRAGRQLGNPFSWRHSDFCRRNLVPAGASLGLFAPWARV
jgi:hypothetical protein